MLEQKVIRYFDAELRAVGEDDGAMRVEGYALKFNKETVIGSKKYGWREKIARTALDEADLSDVIFDFNHSFDVLLARTTTKSLTLSDDDVGLKISAKIVDTADGRDVFKLIKDGLINRMSWMAYITGEDWKWADENSDEMDLRTITQFGRFFDVSAVTFPAYEDTEISARGMTARAADEAVEAWLKAEREKRARERQIARLEEIVRNYKI